MVPARKMGHGYFQSQTGRQEVLSAVQYISGFISHIAEFLFENMISVKIPKLIWSRNLNHISSYWLRSSKIMVALIGWMLWNLNIPISDFWVMQNVHSVSGKNCNCRKTWNIIFTEYKFLINNFEDMNFCLKKNI